MKKVWVTVNMTSRTRTSIYALLAYLWEDEEKSFEESYPCESHIFYDMMRIAEDMGYKDLVKSGKDAIKSAKEFEGM